VDISWKMCEKVMNELSKKSEKLPKEYLLSVAAEVFRANDLPVSYKISVPKRSVTDEAQCEMVLKTGKSKGKRCSLAKGKGSSYCTRHLRAVMGSDGLSSLNENKKKQKEKMMEIVYGNTPKSLTLRQYGSENLYIDGSTNLCFHKNDDESYVAYAVLNEDKITMMGDNEVALCEKNRWKYNVQLYDSLES